MRADERQAAVAYAYAWWMTGDDDAAATALRVAMAAPEPDAGSEEERLVALMRGVRGHLGGLRPMPAVSELALLHDGYGVPLAAAATLAAVPAAQAEDHLAHGRLEALLETVREDFRHPERLGGLAVGNPTDLQHAEECRSCSRARTLFERGARELREVSPVSAPAGLIPGLVAQYAPPVEAEPETAPVEAEPEAAETEAEVAEVAAEPLTDPDTSAPDVDGDTVAVHDLLDAPRDYAVAGDDVLDPPRSDVGADTPTVEELEAMLREESAPADLDQEVAPDADVAAPEAEAPAVEASETEAAVQEEEAAPAALAPDRVPTTPGRRRAAGVLALAGILTLCALVVVWTASGGPEDVPGTDTDPPAVSSNDDSEAPQPPPDEASEEGFGPEQPPNNGFSVAAVGLLLSGSQELAPSGTTIAPDDSMRIAVDYVNGSKGVNLDAVWRVDTKPYRRLHAVVASRASRHVWGIPVPARGWPPGRHRVVVTANDSVAGAIDFTVKATDET